MQNTVLEGFPLSPQQARLWALQQSSAHSPARTLCAVSIEGSLNLSALERGIENLSARHEILRTVFRHLPEIDEPAQLILDQVAIRIEVRDLSEFDAPEQESLINSLFEETRLGGTDADGSPLGLSLITLSPSSSILLISLSPLCADASTLHNLVREISVAYEACLMGAPAQEPEEEEESIQYVDLAEWLRELLESDETEAGRTFWRERRIGTLDETRLPLQRPTTGSASGEPKVSYFEIEEKTVAGLEALALERETSLESLLLASWQTLLWRLTGQPEFVIGVGYDGRNYEELKQSLGLFSRYLPLPCELQADPSFLGLLKEVSETTRRMSNWQQYFSPQHLSATAGEQSDSLPFYSYGFEYGDLYAVHRAAGATFSIFRQFVYGDRFKLKLTGARRALGIQGEIQYDAALFHPDAIERLVAHFLVLLRSINAQPDTNISRLRLLSADDEHQLLVAWTGTPGIHSSGLCLQELFESQAARTPDAVAVTFGEQQLSYEELNAQANRLAHYLRELGVGAESLVGICVERTPRMVVGILGILKAGGAYVPLDPENPQERLTYILADAGISILLTETAFADKFSDSLCRVVCFDADDARLKGASVSNPSNLCRPQNLAYVIYTSGSTGEPKGALIDHANVVRLFAATQEFYQFDELDVWTMFHSYAFDFSVWELWGALLHGGRLVIVPYLVSRSPDLFYELLDTEKVTVLNQTPSAFRQLMQAEASRQRAENLSLRWVVFGGEALELQSLRPWFERHGDEQPRLVNMYGITETTVHVTQYALTREDSNRGTGSLIGRAIADLQTYILDPHLQAVPVGVTGELYIGGDGLARGYLNRPALTAERFIPNPYASTEGERLYRTGDLARYLPDGNIEYLGRTDYQVKIRGFRIELGEIEAVLSSHPDIRAAVVIAAETAAGQQLVAYLVTEDGASANTNDLRGYLKERLPDYMIPSFFMLLDEMPLTPNGKIDRRALPAPQMDGRISQREYIAPRTPIEEMLSGIWKEVLGITQVGVEDNFFELGGHSLLATQLISRVREAFSVELALRAIFESPTLGELAGQVEAGIRMDRGLETPPIKPVGRNTPLPLSFAQERIWFLEQLEPDSLLYNLPVALQFKGQVDIAALEKTFDEIVRRHEVLRTDFKIVKGKPVQVIAPPGAKPLSLPFIDLSALPDVERLAEARRVATQEARALFDLTADSLLRVKLVKLDAETFVLLLTTHHIVCDGWSLGLLTDEVSALYGSYCAREETALPALPVQYADYAVWQREWLSGAGLEKQLDYWRARLSEKLPLIALPTDRPRPAVTSYRGACHMFVLSPALTQSLKSLSQREGVTLYISLLAAFNALLYRYTGQDDIVVGTDIANRNRAEIERLVGTFVNHLVLRTDLSGEPTFRELLSRVKEVCLGAYAHQDLPFERLVEELQPERDWNRFPLFQVKCVLQNMPTGNLELPGAELSSTGEQRVAADGGSTVMLFDLSLSLTETPHGLMGVLEYNTDIFEPQTVARMAEHYQHVLQSVVDDADQRLWELPLLDRAESQKLLADWNDTAAEYPRSQCIQQLFEAQALRTPERIAVESEGRQLSYARLNARANQLAHYLRGLGVGAESLVGICLPRSSEMIVGLLGILKAGGAYVPLDAAYPRERLDFMVEDAGISVLLTHEELIVKLPGGVSQTICLDRDASAIAQQSVENPRANIVSENLAYVIYTSGSTGQPKGVQISHRALVNFQSAMRRRPGLIAEDKLLALTTLSFDIAGFEIYPTLCSGASMVVVDRDEASDGERLAQRLNESGATMLQATPATWQLLLAAGWRNDAKLKMVVGGEALPPKLARQLLDDDGSLWNMYGPTESTIWSAAYHFESKDSPVTIGKPVDNTSLHILDPHLQAVPVGVTGELYIGGDGLARGYLNRPALTAERFIPNPYASTGGERLYRTGDLARYLPDGNIEYLGRADYQVKIRGFRIELGEIEAALSSHPGVGECVVTAHESAGGDKRLVGYVVRRKDANPTSDELRNHLKEQLPDYMVPTLFVLLNEMPLTPNGKVDRRALPSPEVSEQALESDHVAPRTPIEEMLCSIWSELLGVGQVGIHNNFFELGGHSLLATQLLSRVCESFTVELPLRTIFDSPTVSALAEKIEQGRLESAGLLMPPIEKIPRDAELPTSLLQERRLKRYEQEVDKSAPFAAANCSLNFHIKGRLDLPLLERCLNEIIRRHETLRTYFVLRDGAPPLQRIVPSLELNVQKIELSHVPAGERKAEALRIINEENLRRFDLLKLPLLRALLLRLDEEEQVFVLILDHIIFDGQSSEIFLNEFRVIYEAFAKGNPSPLPELPAQSVDYAYWQRTQFQGEKLDAYMDYWRQHLNPENPFPELKLPFAHPVAGLPTHVGKRQDLSVSAELSEALRTLCRQQGITMFMMFLSILKVLIFHNTGDASVGVLTPAANRLRKEMQHLIGFFANIVILQTDLSGDPDFSELLARVRESCIGAFERQDLPFDKVLEGFGYYVGKEAPPCVWFDYVKSNQVAAVVKGESQPARMKITPINLSSGLTSGAFNVRITDEPGSISVGIEYETERYDDADIARMLRQFHHLLSGVVADPQRPLSKLLCAEDELNHVG